MTKDQIIQIENAIRESIKISEWPINFGLSETKIEVKDNRNECPSHELMYRADEYESFCDNMVREVEQLGIEIEDFRSGPHGFEITVK